MGNDNNHDSKNGLISILLLILLTTGSLIPLTSSRPHDPQTGKKMSINEHKADARLWQDPIAAVERHIKLLRLIKPRKEFEKLVEYKSIADFGDQIKEEIGSNLKIVAVSVSGDSYSESVEFRLRYRYAVVSALGTQGYFAKDAGHINFYNLNIDLPSYSDKIKMTVPYEVFGAETKPSKNLLVLWLNEDQIPSEAYRNVIASMVEELQHKINSFSLIGPTNTLLLAELVKQDAIPIPEGKPFKIISSSATISDSDLCNVIGKVDECKSSKVQEIIKAELTQRKIFRSIGQDKNLAMALLWELEQRGINHKTSPLKDKCKDGLILISEQDSLYARLLTKHLENLFNERCPMQENEKPLLRNLTYLRGLDGKLPDHDDINKNTQDEKSKKEQKNLITQWDDASPEHAEGRNQFDYLRRLSATIEQIEREQGLVTNQIKAIGIIGNDVYDKLLILQALKERFKDKIFFTTELDARYLHSDQSRWTRNLIVASNFDLSLHPGIQQSTMPFRDSYQTSMYLATLLALQDNSEISEYQSLKPQIFEIGRTGAIHLASPSRGFLKGWKNNTNTVESTNIRCEQNSLFSCVERDRLEDKRISLENWMIGCAIILFALLPLTFTFYKFIQETFFKPENKRKSKIFLAVFGVLSIILILGIHEDNSPFRITGEPFFWLEGVSVWPNLVIRFLGLAIILFIVFYSLQKKLKEAGDIENEFKFPQYNSKNCSGSISLAEALQGPIFNTAEAATAGKRWLEYREITDLSKPRIYWWIAAAALVPLIFTFALTPLGYLHFPARGEITRNLHLIFSLCQFLLLWLLVFWVGYEVNAGRNFINCLKQDSNKNDQLGNASSVSWSPEFLLEKQEETGIAKDKLEPYARFLFISRILRRVSRLIYIPFVLMLLIVIGRNNIFDNLGLSPALIIIFLSALIYLTIVTSLLRSSAEEKCGEIYDFYEKNSTKEVSPGFGNKNNIEQLMTKMRNIRQSIFAPFLYRPTMIAALLPGGGIGLAQLIEYLYN